MPAAARRIGIAGMAGFLVCMAALHVANWGHNPRHISSYAHLAASPLWYAALACLTAGGFGVAAALRHVAVVGSGPWAVRALGCASLLPVVLAAFPTDRTWTPDHVTTLAGTLHDTASITMVLELCAAMVALWWSGHHDGGPLSRVAGGMAGPLVGAAIFAAWLLDEQLDQGHMSAALQRALLVLLVAWLLRAAWRCDGRAASRPRALRGAAADRGSAARDGPLASETLGRVRAWPWGSGPRPGTPNR